MIDPRAGTTGMFGNLPTTTYKWSGMALDPVTRKMYCPPDGANATSVLIIDPATNGTDVTSLDTGLGALNGKYEGIVYVSSTGKVKWFFPF